MNLAFIGPLKHAGLSLSIGLGACLNAGLLYWQLRKKKIFQPQPGWAGFLIRLLVAVIVMAAALSGMLYWMPDWGAGQHAMAPVAAGSCLCGRRRRLFPGPGHDGLPTAGLCPPYRRLTIKPSNG